MRLTGEEIFTELSMNRQGDRRLVLIVEGDEECQLMDAHIALAGAYTYPAGAKTAVLDAMSRMVGAGHAWALGVVDRDFSVSPPTQSAVVQSRNYDLIMDVVFARQKQIRRLAINAAAPQRVADLERAAVADAHAILFACCVTIGALRLAATMGDFPGTVRNFPIRGIVKAYLEGNLTRFVAAHGAARTGSAATEEDIERTILRHQGTRPQAEYVCGHDYAAALADLVVHCGGSSFGRDAAAVLLRSLGTRRHWLKQPVAQEIAAWAHTQGVEIWRN